MEKAIITALILLVSISLFGCSSNEMKFSEIVKTDISKISSRNSGSGLLYSITDKEKINDFVNVMNSTTYSKAKPYAVGGSSTIRLYDETDVEVTSIHIIKDVYRIGDEFYKMNTNIGEELSSVFSELYNDENLVQE